MNLFLQNKIISNLCPENIAPELPLRGHDVVFVDPRDEVEVGLPVSIFN